MQKSTDEKLIAYRLNFAFQPKFTKTTRNN